MIKRNTKMVSLLIAGVSMLSIIPTTIANASTDVTKLETKDGSITNAVMYDGKYLYEGNKDDADSGLYYDSGSSDKLVTYDNDELDSSIVRKYSDKNVVLDDEDAYSIDLSNGEVTNDDTASSLKDDAVTKLKKQLKKVDRYNDLTLNEDLTEVPSNNFEETYYKYEYTNSTTSSAIYVGFTDKSGKYVDVSRDANVYYFNGDKVVKIKEYSEAGTTTVGTAILKNIEPVAEDSSYIYAIATVDINVSANTDGTVNKVTNYYLQKISKAQGDKEDDAYLPSTTTSYLLTKNVEDTDVKNAYDALLDSTGALRSDVKVNVVNGTVVVTSFDSDAATVTSLYTKNTQVTPIVTTNGTTSTGSKVNLYAVSVDSNDEQDATAVSYDKDGNTWVINDGKIYESKAGADFEQVFKCDSGFNKLDVYDKDNIIAWNEDEESYAVLSKGASSDASNGTSTTTTTTTTTTATAATIKTGWNLGSDGKWTYSTDGTTLVKGNWLNDKGTWYYLDANGIMATGWLNQNGTWYFLNANGSMATGWVNDNGTWYFLNANGSMAHDTTVNGYTLGSNGAWVQ